jgi:hypothetical protein
MFAHAYDITRTTILLSVSTQGLKPKPDIPDTSIYVASHFIGGQRSFETFKEHPDFHNDTPWAQLESKTVLRYLVGTALNLSIAHATYCIGKSNVAVCHYIFNMSCRHWGCNLSDDTCVGCGIRVCRSCLKEPIHCRCENKHECCKV